MCPCRSEVQMTVLRHRVAEDIIDRSHRDFAAVHVGNWKLEWDGCERCGKLLPPDISEAMICSFECTFCSDCVAGDLDGTCPNCGGNFERRPIRPAKHLDRHPPAAPRDGGDSPS